MRSNSPSEGFVCPHCGEALKRNANFCRHCGSDATTGWSDNSDNATAWDDADELEEAYDESLEREFSSDSRTPLKSLKSHRKNSGIPLWVMIVALVLAALLAWQWVRGMG